MDTPTSTDGDACSRRSATPRGCGFSGLLLTGEVCVCHIHESLKVSQPKASRHLAYLRRAGLVEARREGLWVYYRLAEAPDPVVAAVKQAVTHALGHVPGVRKDAQRLQRKNGCCLPVAAAKRRPTRAAEGATEAVS